MTYHPAPPPPTSVGPDTAVVVSRDGHWYWSGTEWAPTAINPWRAPSSPLVQPVLSDPPHSVVGTAFGAAVGVMAARAVGCLLVAVLGLFFLVAVATSAATAPKHVAAPPTPPAIPGNVGAP